MVRDVRRIEYAVESDGRVEVYEADVEGVWLNKYCRPVLGSILYCDPALLDRVLQKSLKQVLEREPSLKLD